MTTITITELAGLLSVTAPYDKRFVSAARRAGGRWNRDAKAWTFDARDRAAVEAALARCYGWAPQGAQTGDFRITLTSSNAGDREVRLLGRRVARRWRRDDDVTIGEGVAVVTGDFPSRAGSLSRPAILDPGDGDVTLVVRDLPLTVMGDEDLVETYQVAPVPAAEQDLEALRTERAQLVRRLAEIDALLAAAEAVGD